MNKQRSRIATALALTGALFCAQAGATSQSSPASAYEDASAPQTMTVIEPDGAITAYTFADAELLAVAEPDGMVTYYELTPLASMPDAINEPDSSSTADDGATSFVPDGTGWAYVPSRFVTPEEAAAYFAVTDENPAPVYIATFVSPPEYGQMSTE